MIDESLIKSNFIGRDGFRWWIGQIPPESSHGGQINGAGWGNRFKVRIMGYHPYSIVELPNEDLPWAQVLLSPSDGTGAGNQATSVKLSPGDTVLGFFLDGDNAQVPVILGAFGRTSQVPSSDYAGPFKPFTGYTSKIKNDGTNILNTQTSEQNANTQKSPRSLSPDQVKKVGATERSAYYGIGDVINAASPSTSNTLNKISTEIENFVNKIRTINDGIVSGIGKAKDAINLEIDKITAKIQKISSGLVNGMINGLYEALGPILNAGLKLLYRTVYAIVLAATGNTFIAHRAGVAAQAAMVIPVKLIQDKLPCVANSVLDTLGSIIKGLISSVADNVSNFASCVSEQFIGALVNRIIGGVEQLLSPVLGGVEKILMGFNLVNFLRSNVEGLLGAVFNKSCNEVAPNYNAPTNRWVIGCGAKQAPEVSIQNIMETANAANEIAQSFIDAGTELSSLVSTVGSFDFLKPNFSTPGFESVLSDCYGGPPLTCGGVEVKIFGSNGVGATAKAILGSIVGEGRSATGSIIGFDVTNGGSGYDFPPFVEIRDKCHQGYGGVGRAIVDYDPTSPTYQQVVDIYIVSEGENYPVSDPAETPDSQPPYIVDDITIVSSGTGYTNDDKVRDINGIEYNLQVGTNGEIVKVLPINSELNDVREVTDLPELEVISKTGYGATLKAKLKPRPKYQGEIKQQIDCISK